MIFIPKWQKDRRERNYAQWHWIWPTKVFCIGTSSVNLWLHKCPIVLPPVWSPFILFRGEQGRMCEEERKKDWKIKDDARNERGRKEKKKEKKKGTKGGRKEVKVEERTEGLIVIIYLLTEVCLGNWCIFPWHRFILFMKCWTCWWSIFCWQVIKVVSMSIKKIFYIKNDIAVVIVLILKEITDTWSLRMKMKDMENSSKELNNLCKLDVC